jgi:1-deoxy-D-xylulose-5-phosphate reductoisomerase
MGSARKHRAVILPVDSEHSAMFQCIQGQSSNEIYKILLTASGGAFYRYDGDLSKVTVEKALAHPNWVMGKKITVDSATLMNKGLETIEAHYLFNVPYSKIQTVIHRQSIVHSAVEFADGSIIAQLSVPDMCLPIQYAMTYPARKPCPIKRLDLIEASRLDFEAPDFKRFPCLALALEAGRKGGTMPTALSAANEVAVNAFIQHRIRFTDIAKVVEKAVSKHRVLKEPGLDEIIGVDAWARAVAEETVGRIGSKFNNGRH